MPPADGDVPPGAGDWPPGDPEEGARPPVEHIPDLHRAEEAWHLRDPAERVDDVWHGHDHVHPPQEPTETVAAPTIGADPGGDGLAPPGADQESPGARPSAAVIAGTALALIGLAMIAVAFFAPGEETVALGSTTVATTMRVPSLAEGTTSPTTPAGIGSGVGPAVSGRTPLRGFGEVEVTLTSNKGKVCRECLLSAFTANQRRRGLMDVTDPDLGGYSGMLFEFPTTVRGSFWMRRTPTPLSIAYFDANGELVSTADMEPCGDSPRCPSYPASDQFRYALEVPQGMLDDLGVTRGTRLRIEARACSKATAGS